MGFLVDTLYWAPTQIDGSPRSLLAMILDPVGACIQPADLEPFPTEDPAEASAKEMADPDTEELKDDEDDAAEAVAKALESKKSAKNADVPAPAPPAALVSTPVAAPIAI